MPKQLELEKWGFEKMVRLVCPHCQGGVEIYVDGGRSAGQSGGNNRQSGGQNNRQNNRQSGGQNNRQNNNRQSGGNNRQSGGNRSGGQTVNRRNTGNHNVEEVDHYCECGTAVYSPDYDQCYACYMEPDREPGVCFDCGTDVENPAFLYCFKCSRQHRDD